MTLNIALLIEAIDEYVEEHENDTGGNTFMEQNGQTMSTLHAFARMLDKYVEKEERVTAK